MHRAWDNGIFSMFDRKGWFGWCIGRYSVCHDKTAFTLEKMRAYPSKMWVNEGGNAEGFVFVPKDVIRCCFNLPNNRRIKARHTWNYNCATSDNILKPSSTHDSTKHNKASLPWKLCDYGKIEKHHMARRMCREDKHCRATPGFIQSKPKTIKPCWGSFFLTPRTHFLNSSKGRGGRRG